MPLSQELNHRLSVIAQELDVCKLLSSNDLKVRKRGMSGLKKLLTDMDKERISNVDDYKRIWNGIFYFIWMSDKPLVQEKDVESISNLIHCFKTHESAMLYIRGFFHSLAVQWNRVSHYRTDKFLMLIRRFLRQIFVFLKQFEWDSEIIESFNEELYLAIQNLPCGLVFHLNDIYVEEIAKVNRGNISTNTLILLLKSYVKCIINLKPSMSVVNNISTNVFGGLARQLKEYIKRGGVTACEIEKKCSTPKNNIENVEENILDSRAGRVNAFLPHIEFDENIVINFLKDYLPQCKTSIKAKNILSQIINMFESISNLRRSLATKTFQECSKKSKKRKTKKDDFSNFIKKSCQQLELEEADIESKSDEKILKQLEHLGDLIQIPIGRKSSTFRKSNILLRKNSYNKKNKKVRPVKTVSSEVWIVSENKTKNETEEIINDSLDWSLTISE